MQRYWQAANYLTVGQIYLRENALLRGPLRADPLRFAIGSGQAKPGTRLRLSEKSSQEFRKSLSFPTLSWPRM
jgi:XFP N-terminal domain